MGKFYKQEIDADKDEFVQEIRDTIVRPTFSIIKDKTDILALYVRLQSILR